MRRLTVTGALSVLPTLAILLSGGAAGTSCLDATEVMLTITTDIPCAIDGSDTFMLTRTFVNLGQGDAAPVAQKDMTCASSQIGSLAIVPGGHDEVRIAVRGHVVDVGGNEHWIVATRRVRFVAHQKLPVPINLSASCLDVQCPDPETQTCVDGVCKGNVAATDGGLVTQDDAAPGDGHIFDVNIERKIWLKDGAILDEPLPN